MSTSSARNNNNFANPTNYFCGSASLDLTDKFCTSVVLPGMSLNPVYLTHGAGSALNLTSDNVVFGACSLSLLIDERYDVYFEFLEILQNNISTTNGTFADLVFDFFIQITDSDGNNIFKVELVNARLQSIGDLELDSSSEETQMILPIELLFDHINYIKSGTDLSLRL